MFQKDYKSENHPLAKNSWPQAFYLWMIILFYLLNKTGFDGGVELMTSKIQLLQNGLA